MVVTTLKTPLEIKTAILAAFDEIGHLPENCYTLHVNETDNSVGFAFTDECVIDKKIEEQMVAAVLRISGE
jgi:hypothetical protein